MTPKFQSAWTYIVFPAVAMLLGWGLRGYIGGGPFGALIPGSFVALSLALLLGYRMETAAMVALFGAIGVGYGGNMTYGQTLGFLRESGTVYWGLLGCLLKGGVWGLLGGAVLGVGLTRYQYDRKSIVIAFLITVAAFYIGVKIVNEPKLIYFSDPVNKPRDESWAGLLLAAIAFLAFLRTRGTGDGRAIPLRFALWGALGGALGFGGGALWMVFGPSFPIEQKWIGWWKMMEFSFGLLFGATLGCAAYRNRGTLQREGQRHESPGESWGPLVGYIAFVAIIFAGLPLLMYALPNGWAGSHSIGALVVRNVVELLFGFIVFGAVTIIFGIRSLHVAWQVAITLTFFHTVLDYVRDLSDLKNFGYTLPGPVQIAILIAWTAVVGYLVYRLQRGPNPVHRLFLLGLWACYLSSCARSFVRKDFLLPPEGENLFSIIATNHASLIFVHGTFTVSAIITTWFIVAHARAGATKHSAR